MIPLSETDRAQRDTRPLERDASAPGKPDTRPPGGPDEMLHAATPAPRLQPAAPVLYPY